MSQSKCNNLLACPLVTQDVCSAFDTNYAIRSTDSKCIPPNHSNKTTEEFSMPFNVFEL